MTDRSSVAALIVDPNTDDVRRFRDALEDEEIATDVRTVSSGTEALDYLYRRGEYTDAERPALVLLDIELPEMDGHRLLEELHETPEFEGIPVIVLTGSDDPNDVARAYERHANAYVRKPDEPDGYIDLARSFADFWLEAARLPPEDEVDGEDERR